MAREQGMKEFLAEFEVLKAKYGGAFTELKAAQFTSKRGIVPNTQDFTPYSCRLNDETGVIECEDDRPV